MFNHLTRSRKLKTVILISAAVISAILFAVLYSHSHAKDFLESLYYSSQVISCIFVVSGVVIAVWQYYLSCQNTKRNLEIIQVQRAIDLSEYYKDSILKFFPAILYVFSVCGISDIMDTIKLDSMNDFDHTELTRLLSPAQIEQLKKIQNSDEFIKAIINANAIYGLNLPFYRITNEDASAKNPSKTILYEKNSLFITFMANLLNATLNNLEFFALHFTHNVADESVVYQSLHQTYLGNMRYLYYYIANQNKEPANKLYTNTIQLFKLWRKKEEGQNHIRSENAKSIPLPGTIIEK